MIRIGKEQLKKLQEKYHTDQAIASLYGVNRQTIYKLRKKYGIESYKNRNKNRNMQIRHLFYGGQKAEKLAVRFNLSVSRIYEIVHNNKEKQKMKRRCSGYCDSLEQLAEIVAQLQKNGKKVVTTNGCFDLLHTGHVTYMQEAAKVGDVLVVGINSDRSVRALKGESRPIQSEVDRAELIAALKPVDYTFIFDEDTPCAFLETLKPDFHVKGGDYSPEDLPEKAVVEAHGGEIKILSLVDGRSTTDIVGKIKAAIAKEQ